MKNLSKAQCVALNKLADEQRIAEGLNGEDAPFQSIRGKNLSLIISTAAQTGNFSELHVWIRQNRRKDIRDRINRLLGKGSSITDFVTKKRCEEPSIEQPEKTQSDSYGITTPNGRYRPL